MVDRRPHVFVRRDGTTFVEKVPGGAMSVETYLDPELAMLRELAADLTAYECAKRPKDRARLRDTLDRVWHVTRGRYGVPKKRR